MGHHVPHEWPDPVSRTILPLRHCLARPVQILLLLHLRCVYLSHTTSSPTLVLYSCLLVASVSSSTMALAPEIRVHYRSQSWHRAGIRQAVGPASYSSKIHLCDMQKSRCGDGRFLITLTTHLLLQTTSVSFGSMAALKQGARVILTLLLHLVIEKP